MLKSFGFKLEHKDKDNKNKFFNKVKIESIEKDANIFALALWTTDRSHPIRPLPPQYNPNDNAAIYQYINNALISDDPVSLSHCIKLIRCINNAIINKPMPKDYIVFRGTKLIHMPISEIKKFKKGEKSRVKMYLATSLKRSIAEKFASKDGIISIIRIPKGCLNAAIIPSQLSDFPNEEEILIPPYSLLLCVGNGYNETTKRFELTFELAKDNKKEEFTGKENDYWKL